MKWLALLVIVFLGLVIKVPAQNFLWVQQGGGAGGTSAHAIKVDPQGNTYATGNFSGDLTFCNTSIISYGQQDIFLAKFDPNGKPLWLRHAGSNNNGESAESIILDKAGNVYISGQISGQSKFGNNVFIDTRKSDIFLAKYNSDGNLQWVKAGGGPDFDRASCLAIDNDGVIYLGGNYQNEITFENQKISGGAGFLVSFQPDGKLKNIQNLGDAVPEALAFDEKKNLYLAGSYSGEGTLIRAPFKSAGGRDIFVTKLNTTTNQIEWTRVGGSVKDEHISSVALDKAGNCYVTGMNGAGFSFGALSIGYFGGFSDFFISKLTADGQVQWLKNGGGTDEDNSLGITVNSTDQIFITGMFTGQAAISNTVSLISQGKGDMFVAGFDINGNSQKVYHIKGPNKKKSMSITSDPVGNLWISGTIPGLTQFGPLTINTPNSFTQMFVAKIGLGPTIANICTAISAPSPGSGVLTNYQVIIPNIITPNADGKNDIFTVKVQPSGSQQINLSIYNRWGKKVLSDPNYLDTWSGSNLPGGLYYYTAEILMDGAQKTLYKGWVEVVK